LSIWNTIKADTVGVLYSAGTGTVDPWTLANLKEASAAALTKAAGPNADPVAVAASIAQNNATIDEALATMPGGNAAPGACTLRIPIFGCIAGPDSATGLKNLELAVDIVLILIVAGVAYAVLKKVGLWGDVVKAFK
jgi:hypothetical protein